MCSRFPSFTRRSSNNLGDKENKIMTEKHPYISGTGTLVQVIKHLRSSFPATVNADTLKKLGLAPKNESYVLNILRFVNVIDDNGKRTSQAQKVFSQHDDGAFNKQFSELVKSSYKELFDLRGEDVWSLGTDDLITFFRSSDKTSAIVGKRQANTFHVLAALSGHGETPEPKKSSGTRKTKNKKKTDMSTASKKRLREESVGSMPHDKKRELGLTVRIEINLPADGDQATYDRIFKSIRENLLNG